MTLDLSGGVVPHSTDAAVVLCDLRDAALSVDDVLAAVRHPSCGGVTLFVGVVRDHDQGHDVRELDYSAHPTALTAMGEVCRVVAERHPGARVAAIHRVGELSVGDLAVVVAAAAPHRDLAFAACRDLIDTLKGTVPIWKHQLFADGGSEWVGLP